jgi:hypothetical protein
LKIGNLYAGYELYKKKSDTSEFGKPYRPAIAMPFYFLGDWHLDDKVKKYTFESQYVFVDDENNNEGQFEVYCVAGIDGIDSSFEDGEYTDVSGDLSCHRPSFVQSSKNNNDEVEDEEEDDDSSADGQSGSVISIPFAMTGAGSMQVRILAFSLVVIMMAGIAFIVYKCNDNAFIKAKYRGYSSM